MPEVSEKELDKALDDAFRTSTEFAGWFLAKTKFASRGGTYSWSRFDHPWCRMPIPSKSGAGVDYVESETDVLVVFAAADGGRFALHIENKRGSGRFTRNQADLYARRAEQWLNDRRYGDYSDFEVVLIAPLAFERLNKHGAAKFDRFVAYEEVAVHIPLFGSVLRRTSTN
jgi:hypothetical protein